VALLDLDRSVEEALVSQTVGPGRAALSFVLDLPTAARHGYGLRLRVADGTSVIEATSAIEALEGWWQAPRHAAMTDYRAAPSAAEAMRGLQTWHVNVVQHYDWMWRHYRYRPPDGASEFVDPLGRHVSHLAVRAAVEAGHARGIASLAYGSVYGAETEYVEEHPDERVFGPDGAPLSLGGLFHITDLRPDSPWRARLLSEYADTIEHFGFDGIHMDTYGPPRTGVGADGQTLDFAALYPGLVEQAAARVADVAPGSRVLFNCVDGFPLEAVAQTPMAAIYLELWAADGTFRDVVHWIDRARDLAGGHGVVVAAYAATLKDHRTVSDRSAAFEAVPLLGSVIAAAGAYHHTLAERNRLLVEGYYPAAIALEPEEVTELKALWRFTARYVHLLSDPGLRVVEPADIAISDAHGRSVPWSLEPRAGSMWVRATEAADGQVLHLVDLRAQPDHRWDEPKRPAGEQEGLRLRWEVAGPTLAASPWRRDGDATALTQDRDDWLLPTFRRWLMVVSR